ncbi:MAG: aldehyde ferredoxin oxidoreductase N-terminal domain-containing protein [Planctomycetota bacterium]
MPKRRILTVDGSKRTFSLRSLDSDHLDKDPREDYLALSGEALAQYLLRQDRTCMVLARGPMPYIFANKTTVGYVSPLTGLPHYSFVGGHSAVAMANMGLDAVVLANPLPEASAAYVTIAGRVPDLQVQFHDDPRLPKGQRAALYYLRQKELGGDDRGSIYTLGEGAQARYRAANVAVEGIYHAGRGGAGYRFAQFARALVLKPADAEGAEQAAQATSRLPAELFERLEQLTTRLSCRDAGTIIKLAATGGNPEGDNTLPAWNAQRLGYPMADIGGSKFLLATREGKSGCACCQVACRHWHHVQADYAPGGKDILLDDFEPAYAVFAMLGLMPAGQTLEAKKELVREADRRIFLPIEQLGCDVIDIGLGIAALFEAGEQGSIPRSDLPDFLCDGSPNFGSLAKAENVVELLRSGDCAWEAVRAIAHGPQALVERYPDMADRVFTCGKGTLGNAGHCNALWTFLMPFSRFFSHYSGQIYKVGGRLPADGDEAKTRALFRNVVRDMLRREYSAVLCNALSCCAFGFVVYSQDGRGEELDRDDRLVQVLGAFGIETTREDLMMFAQAFLAQSIAFKAEFGWVPPRAADFPARVFEALSQTLDRTPEELQHLMDMLIDEWKAQAGALLVKYGHEVPWPSRPDH